MTANLKRYNELHAIGLKYGEESFCSVVAVAMALNISFEQSWTLHKKFGRKANHGTSVYVAHQIFRHLGVEFSRHWTSYKTVKRFYGRGNYLIYTCNHALSYQYDEVLDHSKGSSRRITEVYKIEKIPENLAETIVAEAVVAKPKKKRKSSIKYALINPETQEILDVYKKRPTRNPKNLYSCPRKTDLGKLKYIVYPWDSLNEVQRKNHIAIASTTNKHDL